MGIPITKSYVLRKYTQIDQLSYSSPDQISELQSPCTRQRGVGRRYWIYQTTMYKSSRVAESDGNQTLAHVRGSWHTHAHTRTHTHTYTRAHISLTDGIDFTDVRGTRRGGAMATGWGLIYRSFIRVFRVLSVSRRVPHG